MSGTAWGVLNSTKRTSTSSLAKSEPLFAMTVSSCGVWPCRLARRSRVDSWCLKWVSLSCGCAWFHSTPTLHQLTSLTRVSIQSTEMSSCMFGLADIEELQKWDWLSKRFLSFCHILALAWTFNLYVRKHRNFEVLICQDNTGHWSWRN